jgi:hypothetical protein
MIAIPTARRLLKLSTIQVSTMVLASLLCLLNALPSKAQTETTTDPSLSQQLEKLASALSATRQQVEQSQQQIQRMQAEIDRLRGLLAAKDTPPGPSTAPVTLPVSAPATAAAERTSEQSADSEEMDILKSATAQQQQTKVESSSRLPVRLTGLALFNSFVNQGTVDQIDLPSSALLPSATGSNTSTGATLRQTILGLEGTGPVLAGA